MQVCRVRALEVFSKSEGSHFNLVRTTTRAAGLVWALMLLVCSAAVQGAVDPQPERPERSGAWAPANDGPNFRWVGWVNAFVPGSGQALLGNPFQGATQAVYEIGTFLWGARLSKGEISTLDGFASSRPTRRLRRNEEISLESQLYGDLLQEFGLKSHMVNTYDAYRDAARRKHGGHAGDERKEGIDDESTLGLFLAPYDGKNLSDPYVYVPIILVGSGMLLDYALALHNDVPTVSRLTPYSNFLYAFNYMAWQPIGSGAPEEMFFRGFLQNEFYHWVPSPWFSIPLSTAAFAFSHAPGDGRLSSAIAGAYLGYLAHRYDGRLSRGITLHFWSGVLLGIETVLLNHKGQRTTPPATLSVQVNF